MAISYLPVYCDGSLCIFYGQYRLSPPKSKLSVEHFRVGMECGWWDFPQSRKGFFCVLASGIDVPHSALNSCQIHQRLAYIHHVLAHPAPFE
ncbi:hypothetical protein MBRU_07640 [Mycolicibacterium brumae DSM 44177]|nr:hypothetical protein MBRU_07640 [Mycolicibacterium brumae DSM 44177]